MSMGGVAGHCNNLFGHLVNVDLGMEKKNLSSSQRLNQGLPNTTHMR